MTYRRVLVAIDDSPAGLGAAQAAIDLAAGWGAEVRAITVLRDHTLARALGGTAEDAAARVAAGAQSVVGWAADLAASRRVRCTTVVAGGEPFREILAEADAWGADLVVMGRSDRRGPSSPYLGSETAHVLEFTELPVLVIPLREEP